METSRRFLPSLIVMVILIFALVIGGSTLIYNDRIDVFTEELDEQLNLRVADTTSTLSRELGNIRNLTLLLKNSLIIQRALSQNHLPDTNLALREFIHFKLASPLISSIAWIDSTGQEKVRLDVFKTISRPIMGEDLVNQQDSPIYIKGANALPYSIPIMLTRLQNKTYATATILTGQGDLLNAGMLMIQFDLTELMQKFLVKSDSNIELKIISNTGTWLLNPQPAPLNIQSNFAALEAPAWKAMQSGETSGQFITKSQIWRYHWLLFDDPLDAVSDNSEAMIITASTNAHLLSEYQQSSLLLVGGYAIGILAIGLLIIFRIHKTNISFQALHQTITQEKNKLESTVKELEIAHERQQLLTEQLAESQKLSSLGMMVAGVAHELNTPTGGALISVSVLKQKLAALTHSLSSGLKRSDLDTYVKSAEEGLDLTEHNLQQASKLIKSFKRLAVDRNSEELCSFRLGEPIQDLLTSLSPAIKKSRVNLVTSYPEKLTLFSHAGILSQVIQNLMANALSHAFDPLNDNELQLKAHQKDSQLIISIKDNGKGIAPETLPTIFDPFVTTQRAEGHTGLGLHQVHQWVYKILQGSITVSSTLGEGTEFIVTIPLEIQDHAQKD